MALCRCIEEHAKPNGRKEEYVYSVKPLGYPSSSAICGRKNCKNDGLIWLTAEEYKLYLNGETIFSYASAVCRVKVEKVK